jgi:hypothetical protein
MSTPPPSPNTIEVTPTNVELLDSVGRVMQQRFPHLWGDEMPTRNTIVGFLANEFLTGDPTTPPTLRPVSKLVRASEGPSSTSVDSVPPKLPAERGQVYALRGSDGRLRGTWHIPAYAECPGRAAFAVQHPDEDYSLVDLDEVERRRLKQCAFCLRYERGEL